MLRIGNEGNLMTNEHELMKWLDEKTVLPSEVSLHMPRGYRSIHTAGAWIMLGQ
jgi:hypothetical protein